MKITTRMLKSKSACASQVALFEDLFPDGGEVTEAACVAVFDKFNWDWAARNLLSAPAYAEYERVTAPAYAEYQRVRASTYAEYERVRAPAYAEYQRVSASAAAECERVRAPAAAEYKRVTASAFGRLASTAE